MRTALIIAGGSGTRLWPMSRGGRPKQLIPLVGGRSLLQVSWQRLEGLVARERVYICAGESQRSAILESLPAFLADNYVGEPEGRDTLNAVALGSAVIGRGDAEAVIGVFTADHVIEPVEDFQRIVRAGYELAEGQPRMLVTFGIAPTHAATGYGYLELGEPLAGEARAVRQFKEKPDEATARRYLEAGPQKYLWNSGMFVWQAATLLDCVKRYEAGNYREIQKVAEAWGRPDCGHVLAEVYPRLKKISVDYAVMEPASRDPQVRVAAVPMPLRWLDVGSWPSFGEVCPKDDAGNALGPGEHVLMDSRNNVVACEAPGQVVAAIGCEGLVIIHTAEATLVCPADRAEEIKKLHEELKRRVGQELA